MSPYDGIMRLINLLPIHSRSWARMTARPSIRRNHPDYDLTGDIQAFVRALHRAVVDHPYIPPPTSSWRDVSTFTIEGIPPWTYYAPRGGTYCEGESSGTAAAKRARTEEVVEDTVIEEEVRDDPVVVVASPEVRDVVSHADYEADDEDDEEEDDEIEAPLEDEVPHKEVVHEGVPGDDVVFLEDIYEVEEDEEDPSEDEVPLEEPEVLEEIELIPPPPHIPPPEMFIPEAPELDVRDIHEVHRLEDPAYSPINWGVCSLHQLTSPRRLRQRFGTL